MGKKEKLDALQLSEILHITRQHAYALIRGTSRLTDAQRDLIAFKVFRQIPGWPEGFVFCDGGIYTPTGRFVNHEQVAQIEWIYHIHGFTLSRKPETLEAIDSPCVVAVI